MSCPMTAALPKGQMGGHPDQQDDGRWSQSRPSTNALVHLIRERESLPQASDRYTPVLACSE